MAYFKYGDKNIYYEMSGNGPALVLLHGSCMSSGLFDKLATYLKNYTIIKMDFLGYGKSDKVENTKQIDFGSQANQVISLMRHIHCTEAYIFGDNIGAVTAINVAILRRSYVKAVIANDTICGRQGTLSSQSLTIRKKILKIHIVDTIVEHYQGVDYKRTVALEDAMICNYIRDGESCLIGDVTGLPMPMLFIAAEYFNGETYELKQKAIELASSVKNGSYKIYPFNGIASPIFAECESMAATINEFLSGIKDSDSK